jgi:Kef-type K+ transport system membrane component KefB
MSLALLAAPDAVNALSIPLMLLMVFGSAKLLAEVAIALRQPGIVGEICAGILIGPSVLNWCQPSEILHFLSDLGVLFLLFLVGLEVKPSALFGVGKRAILVAVGGVVLPLFAGAGLGFAFGNGTTESIFLGAALVATSVGITARVLSEKGLVHTETAQVILAAAVFDDILGLLVLAAVSGMAKGNVNYLELGTSSALAIGFTILVAKFGSRAAGKIVKTAEKEPPLQRSTVHHRPDPPFRAYGARRSSLSSHST